MIFNKKKQPLSLRMTSGKDNMIYNDRRMLHASRSFLQITAFSLILTLVCIVCDVGTLYQLIDDMLTLEKPLVMIVTSTIAATENVLPLLMVFLWIRHKYQPDRYSILPVVICLLCLAGVFTFLTVMRWKMAPFSFDHTAVKPEDLPARNQADKAAAILLSVLPVATSVCNGVLFYISPNIYDQRRQALRERILQLEQQKIEVLAVMDILQDPDQLEENLRNQEDAAYQAEIESIQAIIENWKAYSIQKLAGVLHDPNVLARNQKTNAAKGD